MNQYSFLDVSFYQIQLFLTVAEAQNFTKAAELLHLTQPTLSKRIIALENTLGYSLFNREKRPVELTKEGKSLYHDWKYLSNQFEDSISRLHGHSALLKVGLADSSCTIKPYSSAAQALEREVPGLNVIFEYKQYHKWHEIVMDGEVDLVFVLAMERKYLHDQLNYKTVAECPNLAVMLKTNPLSTKSQLTYEDLREQRFIINSHRAMPSHYEFIREEALKHGFLPTISKFTHTTHDLIACLREPDEVVICDMFLRDLDNDFIKIFELPGTPSGLIAVWRKDNLNPYIPLFLQLIETILKTTQPTIPK